jgi:sporulation protein YlmC with PRC-barrel domain
MTIPHVFALVSTALFCGIAAGQDAASSLSSSETKLESGDVRASNLLGAMVKRLTGDPVGEVKDLIVSADADVRLAVISVGGVLGVGGKTIALPFDQFQVAPDGATIYLALSEEELATRPPFDLENVTADSRATAGEPAAQAQQTIPQADDFGARRDGTAQESFVSESAQPAELAASQQAQAAEQARLAEQAQLEQQAQEAEQAELAHQAALAELSEQAQRDYEARQAEAASKTKASNQPASALIGAEVVDTRNSAIGKVNDVVVTAEPPEVQVIVQLSEEIAGDAKLVAVPLPELTISQGGADDTSRTVERVETELTIAQLEALPQFQY